MFSPSHKYAAIATILVSDYRIVRDQIAVLGDSFQFLAYRLYFSWQERCSVEQSFAEYSNATAQGQVSDFRH